MLQQFFLMSITTSATVTIIGIDYHQRELYDHYRQLADRRVVKLYTHQSQGKMVFDPIWSESRLSKSIEEGKIYAVSQLLQVMGWLLSPNPSESARPSINVFFFGAGSERRPISPNYFSMQSNECATYIIIDTRFEKPHIYPFKRTINHIHITRLSAQIQPRRGLMKPKKTDVEKVNFSNFPDQPIESSVQKETSSHPCYEIFCGYIPQSIPFLTHFQ